jgi:hypothetical protein
MAPEAALCVHPTRLGRTKPEMREEAKGFRFLPMFSA